MSAHRWCWTAQSTANLQHFEAVVGSTKLEEDERRRKKLIQQTAPTNLQFSPKSSRNIRKHRKSITKPSHQRNWFSLTVEITWHLSFRDEKYVKKKKKRTSRLKSLTKPICDIKNCYKIDTTRSRTPRYIPQSLLQHLKDNQHLHDWETYLLKGTSEQS